MTVEIAGLHRSDWRSRITGRNVYRLDAKILAQVNSEDLAAALQRTEAASVIEASLLMRSITDSERLIGLGFRPIFSELSLTCTPSSYRPPPAASRYRLRRGARRDLSCLTKDMLIDEPLLVDEVLCSAGCTQEPAAVFETIDGADHAWFVLEGMPDLSLAAAAIVEEKEKVSFAHCHRDPEDLEAFRALTGRLADRYWDLGASALQTSIAAMRTTQINAALSLGFQIREVRMHYHWIHGSPGSLG